MKYRLKIALNTCSPNPIQILHKLHTQYCHWISNYQRGRVWILLTKFNPITDLYLSQARIKCHMSWSYFIFNDLRWNCLFCWYWLNCWPWLFKLSFHQIFQKCLLFIAAYSSHWLPSKLLKRLSENNVPMNQWCRQTDSKL